MKKDFARCLQQSIRATLRASRFLLCNNVLSSLGRTSLANVDQAVETNTQVILVLASCASVAFLKISSVSRPLDKHLS